MDTPKQRNLSYARIDHLTQVGRAVVEAVQMYLGYGRSFVIAGGLFRDTLLGGPVSDVDVFVLPNESHEVEKAYQDRPDDYGDLAGAITQIGAYRGHPVQKIALNPGRFPVLSSKVVCDRIDIGICRIAMDHTGTLYFSEKAVWDYEHQTLTVLRTNGADANRVIARLEKMKGRYPNQFTVSDPQGLLEKAKNEDLDFLE